MVLLLGNIVHKLAVRQHPKHTTVRCQASVRYMWLVVAKK